MHDSIQVGAITVTFIKSEQQDQGALNLYEMILPTQSSLCMPRINQEFDETVLAIEGTTTWLLNTTLTHLKPGEQIFIPRGVNHSYGNFSSTPARILCMLTPGNLGPGYFHEIARIFNAPGPTDLDAIRAIMLRYGVTPGS